MNLLDRLNGIYSAKSEVPINWLVARAGMPLTFSRISSDARFSNGQRTTAVGIPKASWTRFPWAPNMGAGGPPRGMIRCFCDLSQP